MIDSSLLNDKEILLVLMLLRRRRRRLRAANQKALYVCARLQLELCPVNHLPELNVFEIQFVAFRKIF